jgi:hypothetical protein
MTNLNKIERAVLEVMIERNPTESAALRAQLRSATVDSRTNTGAGFYSYFRVASSNALVSVRVIDDVFANIDGLDNPVVFVLFTKDGYIQMLEGATIEESSKDIDFSQVEFEIHDAKQK